LIVSNARSKPLDPSLPLPIHGKVPTTAKMGIDATIPENIPAERYKRIVYFNQGKVKLADVLDSSTKQAKRVEENLEVIVDGITATLAQSHCFFAELLEKFPDASYKQIGGAIARLYEHGKITQASDGKLALKN
jgi:2,5-furandicarboxylate decarboxylase 1